ncbi:MAG: YicC family protein [Gemmatimonadaceae bacterium]|nr:YicC family protein [Gemmatimonadaceae bacterium]MCC6431681.1 YicC family protein [Gemmatimonadaceae bacterium]
MTGFGQADGTVGTSRVSVEVRTVNHRFFSPSIKLPGAFARWEADVREAMRLRVSRGHVTLTARAERAQAAAAGIDEARVAEVVARLRAVHERFGLDGGVDLATVLRMPDVIASPREEDESGTVTELVAIAERALEGLGRARAEEGERLAVVLRQRLELLSASLDRISARAPERLLAQRDRLRAAVRELTDGLAVDEQRLAQEIAILADRLDVSEEMDRFRSHIAAFRLALSDSNGEPVGKRLGFLLQEMVREANTTGSKGADSSILHEVVAVKEELERIREQVENLE